MGRIVGRLTARQAAQAKPRPGREWDLLADGGNLYLQVTTGSGGVINRSWLFKFQQDDKRGELGLGALHTVSLREARDRARVHRQQLIDGINPLTVKHAERKRRRLEAAKSMTFGACVAAYLATHEVAWRNEKHRQQWRMTLTKYCKPISDLQVKDVDTDLVLRVLTPLWTTRTETAKRLRGRIERVLSWAKGRGLRDGENPARWSGHLDEMLPSPAKIAAARHHPALPYPQIGELMVELRNRDSVSARALEFTILTAARTGETIGATWGEIDLDARTWAIPSSRMKAGKKHVVPLPERAIEILESLPRKGEYVFADASGKPLSNMAMLEMLRGMRPGLTVHGFRSCFADWAHEQTAYPGTAIDAALAHKVSDKVEAAYRRGDPFEKRRRLMAEWARYLAKPMLPAGATVTSMVRR